MQSTRLRGSDVDVTAGVASSNVPKAVRLPGFIAETSAFERRGDYSRRGTADAWRLPVDRDKIVPQQQPCSDFHGTCTGIWPGYRGEQCVQGASGFQQCCTAAGTW